jgi:molybdate transport system ATP-binding protein
MTPTHALLLGQGEDGTSYEVGEWGEMEATVEAYFEAQRDRQWVKPVASSLRRRRQQTARPPLEEDGGGGGGGGAHEARQGGGAAPAAPLVDFREITVRYNSHVVFDRLSWLVREGEKWVVVGGNGTGKSTLVELITGDNVQGYQNDVHLFGRKKGSGESIWEVKSQLGVLSTEFHMEYIDYADPSLRTAFRRPERLTTWDVVCSGFFDSVGLYSEVSLPQEKLAKEWIERLELHDLITPPARAPGGAAGGATTAQRQQQQQEFFHLSHGQQKLVLLARAMIKSPRLLLLDEPTHGLSGNNKERVLHTLSLLAEEPEVAVVYVTHRQEEIDALGFEHTLHLGASSSRR